MLFKNGFSVTFYKLTILSVTIFLIGSQFIDYQNLSHKILSAYEDIKIPLANVNETYMANAPIDSMKMKCGKFPSMQSLQFKNMYWQQFITKGYEFHLYGAYLDLRVEAMEAPLTPGGPFNLTPEFVSKEKTVGPSIRLIGMLNKINPSVKTYCQIWFDYELVTEPVIEYKLILPKQKEGEKTTEYPHPYLITCRIPKKFENKIPSAVSLVGRECDHASNMLRVVYNKPKENKKKKYAVCVKGLSFLDDHSIKLAEWFELINILGAEKIYVYNLAVHPNVAKVLDYYQKKGMVDVKPLTLPGDQPNAPINQSKFLEENVVIQSLDELVPYNDCLYRNIYRYEFISLLDIDEVIVPMKHNSWEEMFKQVLTTASKDTTSLAFRNVYFLHEMLEKNKPDLHQDIPSFLHMLQHVYRSRNHTTGQIKSFHNTEKVKTLHNHNAFSCLKSACIRTIVDTAVAQMHHYRKNCPNGELCDSLYRKYVVEDTTIWRWKDQLISRTVTALTEMGLLEK